MKRGKWVLAFAISTNFLLGCAAGTAGTAGDRTGAAPAGLPQPRTVASLLKESPANAGQLVEVEGSFKGWKGRCEGGPPRTRSDWMLEDASGCIYVTGPQPAGTSPLAGEGKPVRLRAYLRIDRNGRPYLEAVSTR